MYYIFVSMLFHYTLPTLYLSPAQILSTNDGYPCRWQRDASGYQRLQQPLIPWDCLQLQQTLQTQGNLCLRVDDNKGSGQGDGGGRHVAAGECGMWEVGLIGYNIEQSDAGSWQLTPGEEEWGNNRVGVTKKTCMEQATDPRRRSTGY